VSKIIFFSSPIGLGHATRDIAIAQYLDKISTKFASGEGASKLFSDYGFDAEDVYRPPSFVINHGKLQNPLIWLFKFYLYYKECKTISSRIIEKEKHNLIRKKTKNYIDYRYFRNKICKWNWFFN